MMKNNKLQSFLVENVPWITCLGALFLIWHVCVSLCNVPEYILPSPLSILVEIGESYEHLLRHSTYTIYEILLGFTLGVSVAFVLSLGILYSKTIERVVYPFLIFFQVVPKIALAPLFLIWFGYGALPKILVSAVVCFFPVVINSVRGLRAIDAELLDLTSSLNATPTQVLLKIRIPSSLPYVFAGLRVAITLSVIGAIVGEFIGADKGLGYLIMISNANLETTMMFATLFVLSCLGIILFLCVCGIEKLVFMKWPVAPVGSEL